MISDISKQKKDLLNKSSYCILNYTDYFKEINEKPPSKARPDEHDSPPPSKTEDVDVF